MQIQAAADHVDAVKASSGLRYTYQNTLGPRAVIVPRSYDYHVVRYEQSAGVSYPLFGSRLGEQIAILDAQQQQRIAEIALAADRRDRLAALRSAYVSYWNDATLGSLAEDFARNGQGALSQARILLTTGFMTNTDILDLMNTIGKAQSSARNYRTSQTVQLAQVAEALGTQVAPFSPVQPAFFQTCTPLRQAALESAFRNDPMLAQLNAEIAEIQQEAKHVKYSSINANATLTAGSSTDVNYQVSGYNLIASLSLSAPHHGRAEERATAKTYKARLDALALQQSERRNALTAAVDADLMNIENARTTLFQSTANLQTSVSDLQKAVVRYRTIHQGAGQGFTEVQNRRDQVYAMRIAQAQAQADVLQQAVQLLQVAPDACTTGSS